MDFVANLLRESEQKVATIDGEDLDGDWLEQIPSLVDLVDVIVDKLETSVDKSRAALTRFRINDSIRNYSHNGTMYQDVYRMIFVHLMRAPLLSG